MRPRALPAQVAPLVLRTPPLLEGFTLHWVKPPNGSLSKNLALTTHTRTGFQVSISNGKIPKTYTKNRINVQSHRDLFYT